MKFRFSLLVCTLPVFLFAGAGTERSIISQEVELVHLLKAYTQSPYSDFRDSLARQFRNELTGVLSSEKSLGYNFDSLRKYMSIVRSADGRLRTFSWDERDGGTWHNITSYAQFRGGDGLMHIEQLDTDSEDVSGAFSDVKIYSVHTVERNGRTAYLLLGAGTHGGGLHHAQARLFTIGHRGLELCSDAFNGTKEAVAEIPRTYPVSMSYDEQKQVLSYNDYIWSDASAGKTRCLRNVELKLVNGRFRKSG
ncbi:MAG: hypothetical protein FD123_3581 [Bacteroidetes bacterium]|nr:MAG: hypothetical protein FD123_3581 [Bacteroidota bacterium]